MSMNLIKGNNPKLKKVCTEIGLKPSIKYAKQMIKFFSKMRGYGLAAPQVGRTIRVFIMRYNGKTTACINPIILETGRKKIKNEEGCLSHSYTQENMIKVKRPEFIKVAYHGINGKYVEDEYEYKKEDGDWDYRAIIFQHEMDHLNGICIVDK